MSAAEILATLTPAELALLREAGTVWGCRDYSMFDPSYRRLLDLHLVSLESEAWVLRTTVAGRDVLLADMGVAS